MSDDLYTTPLSVTSQFPFCGLPLRLDTYRGCGFQCGFCFARYRGGNSPKAAIVPSNPNSVKNTFERALRNEKSHIGILGQFLRRRVPIHFGGMSDPFQPAEIRYRVTRDVLRLLCEFRYPTVISTRGILLSSSPYLDLLKQLGPVVVQFSMSSSRDDIAKTLEPNSFPPTEIMRCMETLAGHGVPITCRWQPYVPGTSETAEEFAARISSTGCVHVSFEHLKVPVERNNALWRNFTQILGRDLDAEYRSMGAVRDGREFVLPSTQKLRTVIETARVIHRFGMTFGAADNELQYLSDTDCCCSGADLFPGFENFFRHQIGYAVRKCRGRRITYSSIEGEWAPQGSVDRFLNSNSRISKRNHGASTIRDHIIARWNQPNASGNPSSFFGVVLSGRDKRGMLTYKWMNLSAVARAVG